MKPADRTGPLALPPLPAPALGDEPPGPLRPAWAKEPPVTETLTAIEVGAASSVAVTRVAKEGFRRLVGLTVIEGFAPLTLGDKTIAGEQSTAAVWLGVEQVDRLIADLTAARRWLALHEEHGAIEIGGEG